jgi:hypothetical protein
VDQAGGSGVGSPNPASKKILSGEKVIKASRLELSEPISIPKSNIEGWFDTEMLYEIAPIFPKEDRRLSLQASAQTTLLSSPAFLPIANVVSDKIFLHFSVLCARISEKSQQKKT